MEHVNDLEQLSKAEDWQIIRNLSTSAESFGRASLIKSAKMKK